MVYTCWVSVQKSVIHFWAMLAQFWPSRGQKITFKCFKMVVSDRYLKKCSHNPIQTWCVHLFKWVFRYDLLFGRVGQILALMWPLVATKWLKMVVSDHYLEKCSCNPIQTWCVHLLCECSELICFFPRWPNFGPLVTTKWLKLVVSNHYLEEYSRSPIQTLCVHLLDECSEIICFLATLAKFWPFSSHKMPENGSFRPLSEKVFMQSNSNLGCTLIGWVFRIGVLFGHVGQILSI